MMSPATTRMNSGVTRPQSERSAGSRGELDQALGGADRLVAGVGHRHRADGLGVANPEDMGPDEGVVLVQRVEPADHLSVDLLRPASQLGQDLPAAIQEHPVPRLQPVEDRPGLGPSRTGTCSSSASRSKRSSRESLTRSISASVSAFS